MRIEYNSNFGIPYEVMKIIDKWGNGSINGYVLAELCKLYPYQIRTWYTYKNGLKLPINKIEFGCPVIFSVSFI